MIKMIRRQKTPSSQPLLYLSLPFNKKQLASSTKTPEDYLAELPPARDLDPSRLSSLIRAELLRVSEGRPMPPLDASRYRLDPPPPDRRGDAGAWRACLDNARAARAPGEPGRQPRARAAVRGEGCRGERGALRCRRRAVEIGSQGGAVARRRHQPPPKAGAGARRRGSARTRRAVGAGGAEVRGDRGRVREARGGGRGAGSRGGGGGKDGKGESGEGRSDSGGGEREREERPR